MIKRLELLAKEFKFSNTASFLSHVQFLKLQPSGKSQDYLLSILDEELTKNYGLGLAQCGTASKKYAIYIDDVLATGGTVFKDTFAWLSAIDANGKSNLTRVIGNESTLIISLFCRHNWPNIPWRLKLQLNNDAILRKIKFYSDYEIENHPGFQNQRLNFAYPIQNQPSNVLEYFNNIPAQDKATIAFRRVNEPTKETLFSSPENRMRFENIILRKGIELLQKAQALKSNHRPLGATFPSYKTLGTGTLFFTWRNISNTCPIVFWWDAGVWLPLFPLNQTLFSPRFRLMLMVFCLRPDCRPRDNWPGSS